MCIYMYMYIHISEQGIFITIIITLVPRLHLGIQVQCRSMLYALLSHATLDKIMHMTYTCTCTCILCMTACTAGLCGV